MGQYYLIVNVDKKQYLRPWAFGDGVKLMEFAPGAEGTMLALAVLLADGNGRGGGDFSGENPLIGSWAGDRIVISGDYADDGKFAPPEKNLYTLANEEFENISDDVRSMLEASGHNLRPAW